MQESFARMEKVAGKRHVARPRSYKSNTLLNEPLVGGDGVDFVKHIHYKLRLL
jgi:hypothetical protein